MSKYYVRATGGSDSNSGATFALGWATLAYALGAMSDGDELSVCSDSTDTFEVSTALTISTTDRYILTGADLVDGTAYDGTGKAYITATAAVAIFGTWWINIHITDICLDGGGVATFGIQYAARGTRLTRCRVTNVDGTGIAAVPYSSGEQCTAMCFDCEIDNCDIGCSVESGSSSRVSRVFMYNCSIHHNRTSGLAIDSLYYMMTSLAINGSRIFRNGIGIDAQRGSIDLKNSLVCYNTSNGIYFTSDGQYIPVFYNNVIAYNIGYGINYNNSAGTFTEDCFLGFMDYNLFYGNADGNVNTYFNDGEVPGDNNLFEDPKFTSVTDGSEDWTPQNSSPLLYAGIGYTGGQ